MSYRFSEQPPLPSKIEIPSKQKSFTTRREWEHYFLQMVKHYRRMDSQRKEDVLNELDLTDVLAERRKQAFLATVGRVQKEYGDDSALQWAPNYIGKRWAAVCLAGETFEELESEQHILRAAALWILDQIGNKRETRQKLFKLLPTEDWKLDRLYDSAFWHPQYSFDLVQSVVCVLRCRNTEHPDLRFESAELPRALTDEPTAQGVRGDFLNRKNFEQILELIPSKSIDTAVQRAQELYRVWEKAFFDALAPYASRIAEADAHIIEAAKEHNRIVDQMSQEAKETQRLMKVNRPGSRAPRQGKLPLRSGNRLPQGLPSPEELFRNPGLGRGMGKLQRDPLTASMDRLQSLAERADSAVSRYNARIGDYEQVILEESRFIADFVSTGGIHLQLSNSFELCFALLCLIDRNDDLPWTYGPCIGLMHAVADNLPWGLYEYDEDEDPIWCDFDSFYYPAAKPSSIPDWYERKYRRKDCEPRSLAQLLYEYTGCLLPQDMHLYDGLGKELRKWGIRTKDGSVLFTAMAALGTSQRQIPAFNLKDWRETAAEEQAAEAAGEASEQVEQLTRQVRQLRAALHEAERGEREARKELEQERELARRERRELADLRDYVFLQEQEEQLPESSEPELALPYEVRRSTLIFGGHESWVKPMKELLSGNVRYIERGFVFDTAILRGAEALWIQPNAMPHTMYYRIIDQARRLKKPVRYFTHASATLCAQQVALAEQGR